MDNENDPYGPYEGTSQIKLLIWLIFWPLSEIFGRPPEMDEPIPPLMLLKAVILGLIVAGIVIYFA